MTESITIPPTDGVLFGHHFAAIAGAGPLIGPMLAAQFGYLPGFLWILIGAALAGAVHDMVISRRRCAETAGRSRRSQGRNRARGRIRRVLGDHSSSSSSRLRVSAWRLSMHSRKVPGDIYIGLTIPIALLMGFYLKFSAGQGRRGERDRRHPASVRRRLRTFDSRISSRAVFNFAKQ